VGQPHRRWEDSFPGKWNKLMVLWFAVDDDDDDVCSVRAGNFILLLSKTEKG
jgi:hypothetical protein